MIEFVEILRSKVFLLIYPHHKELLNGNISFSIMNPLYTMRIPAHHALLFNICSLQVITWIGVGTVSRLFSL